MNQLLLALFTAMISSGQLLFRRTGLALQGLETAELPRALLRQPSFYAALLLYGTSTLLWVWLLARVPLSQAYPWVALSVVLVPLLAALVLGEQIRPLFWAGAALIVAGVLVTQAAAGPG